MFFAKRLCSGNCMVAVVKPDFHTDEHLRTYTEPQGTEVPSPELRQKANNTAGRAVAQGDSRRLRFDPGSRHVGICGGQSGTGAGYLRVLRFPLPIHILPTALQSLPSIYHLGLVQ
jgi:hypothetical protein